MTAYAELQVTSNFSFLRGGSHPEELVLRAAELGLTAIALTDRNTLAGVVRAHVAAREVGIRFVVGARLDLMPEAASSMSSAGEATDSPRGAIISLSPPGSFLSPPGLTRGSMFDVERAARNLDCRVKPGNDDWKRAEPGKDTVEPGNDDWKRAEPGQDKGRSGSDGTLDGNHSPRLGEAQRNPTIAHATSDGPRPASGDDREVHGNDEKLRNSSKNASSEAAKGCSLLCFPTDRAAYGRLSRLISLGQRRAPKGKCELWLDDVLAHAEGQIVVILPPEKIDGEFEHFLNIIRQKLPNRCYLAAQHLYRGDDGARIDTLAELAAVCGTPLVATGDVLYHAPARRPLQDVLTCIREHCTIDDAGYRLEANAERHLKPPSEMARLFERHPEALARTLEITEVCRFVLDELRYEYPIDPAPAGMSVQAYLEQLTRAGAAERYPEGVPAKVESLLDHEFTLIAALGYAPYFLTVHDIVRFARSRGILCQGRGSAANSAVCYCLGITAVDPERFDLLFERFVSTERNEPPDIDVDFEHERREEVIQYIYGKYGRAHAGIAATVIHYRARSAIREVGKALGLSEDAVGALASGIWGWSEGGLDARLAKERGLDPAAPRLRLALQLAGELTGFPRHLSQHVGGFVLTKSRLDQVVPVVNAAMAERTMVEWDKDDLDALGILKIDVLALGMLTCVRKAFELIERHYGRKLDLATVPPEDPAVYEMLGRADSIGVFQVESRAQMTMLPRLRPKCFYDLVIEVAIVRPGPIQGDMVHPYLRRRSGLESVSYPSAALKGVLEKTLGVPLFQEQAMQIAIVGAGFTPSEADRLRRAMATFKRVGTIHTFRDKFIDGMVKNGYERAFAERCFKQIEGFGTYGFPESHAASFALLVYVSSWLKCHHPEVFACALLNSQPMGFYAPAQIVRDARDHGVSVLPVDVNASDWDCTLEVPAAPEVQDFAPLSAAAPLSPSGSTPGCPVDERCLGLDARDEHWSNPRLSLPGLTRQSMPDVGHLASDRSMDPRVKPGGDNQGGDRGVNGQRFRCPPGQGGDNQGGARVADDQAGVAAALRRALRLGFRQVKGLKQEEMTRLAARRAGGYVDLADLRRRAEVSASALDRLARADAFRSLTLDRRGAIWRAIGLDRTGHELDLPPLFAWAAGRTVRPEPAVALPTMTLGQEVVEDYANLRLTLRAHPLALLRGLLPERVVKAERLAAIEAGRRVEVAGLTLVRQRPGTASGVIFITLEDESGIANLVVWPAVFERFRRVVLGAQLMMVRGRLQKEGIVIHVVAEQLIDRTDLLRRLAETSFEAPVAPADRIKHPSDSGERRRSEPPPFEAPLAHADHAKNSGPPDPRDPGHRSRRQRLLARLGRPEAFEAPVARADELKRNTRNVRELHPKASGFRSRDFH
jgi:error-prone DNA polymerase